MMDYVKTRTLTVTLAHDPASLDALCEQWPDLQQRSDTTSIYMTWEWTRALWDHFGHEATLWLFQARDEIGRLVGLAPLMLYDHRPMQGFRWRQLEFVGNFLFADHLDFIAERGMERAVSRAIWQAILQAQGQFDTICLTSIPDDSPNLAVMRELGIPWAQIDQHLCPRVDLPGDWESYLASLSKGKRKEHRKFLRQLDEHYPNNWHWRLVDRVDDLDVAFDDLIRLHQAKWEALGQPGAFSDPKVVAFHRDVMRRLLRKGCLRLYRLCVDGRLAATLYAYQVNGTVFDYASGLDLQFAEFSPGEVLTGIALQQAIESGAAYYDFLRGEQEYKLRWGGRPRVDVSLCWLASPRARRDQQLIDLMARMWRSIKGRLPDTLRRKVTRLVRPDA